MGCGDSKPKLAFDDFKIIPDGASKEEVEKIAVVVDKKSITAVWGKKYPNYELTSKDLADLVPSPPITDENEEELFPAFRDKFLKLADRKRRLDELAKDPKPYLDQYFALRGKYAASCLEISVGNILAIAAHGTPETYVQDKCGGWHKNTGTPLIAKSVDHHDTNGDGVLDPEESQLFFKHLLDCQVKYSDTMVRLLVVKGIDLMLFADPKTRNNPAMVKMFIMSKVQPRLDYLHKALTDAFAAFTKDEAKMAEGSKKAFAVMDKNGDGTLQVEEVAAILAPGGDGNTAFWQALGFDCDAIVKKAGEEYDEAHKEDENTENGEASKSGEEGTATLFGNIYVSPKPGRGIGVTSWHFDSASDCYISYANAGDMFKTDDGEPFPAKKSFENSSFNSETRTFTGVTSWTPKTAMKSSKWEFEIKFSPDLSIVSEGHIKLYDVDGKLNMAVDVGPGTDYDYVRSKGGDKDTNGTNGANGK